MKQSKLMSLAESVINIVFGLVVQMTAMAVLLPLLGFPITFAQNSIIAACMTVVSIARSFVLRRLFEALHIRNPLSAGALAIVAERRRQIEQEGWTPAHDASHVTGDLARAGACYAAFGDTRIETPPSLWPWDAAWWKPQDYRRNLVKAGALILAELDRLDWLRKNRKVTGL